MLLLMLLRPILVSWSCLPRRSFQLVPAVVAWAHLAVSSPSVKDPVDSRIPVVATKNDVHQGGSHKAKSKANDKENSSNTMKVIVFGATGVIGLGLIDILSQNNPEWQIYAVSRSDSSSEKFAKYENVNVLRGDPKEKEETMALCADKDLVFSTLGVSKYEAKHWAKEWPLIVDNLLAASSQQPQQKFVFCDNLYAYGAGRNLSPSSKLVEPSLKTKPAIRSLIHSKLQSRMDENPDSISVVGGSDFFGPGVTNFSFLGDTFTKAIVSGKSRPLAIGSATKVHDCALASDFSKA